MEISQMLRDVSKLVFENVKDMAGTEKAAGDFGRGAGGDISRNICLLYTSDAADE